MPERLESLRRALIDLENELETVDVEDHEAQALLVEAKLEIEAALAKADHPNDLESHPFIDRLTEAEASFEASHPTVAGVLRRLIDVLGQMGI